MAYAPTHQSEFGHFGGDLVVSINVGPDPNYIHTAAVLGPFCSQGGGIIFDRALRALMASSLSNLFAI